jgi:hypothetical protein
MGQTLEAKIHYEPVSDTIAVEWPWFHTQHFRLTRGDDMERMAAALKVFCAASREVVVNPRDKYIDILALRNAVEAAEKKVRKFSPSGKEALPTFEELFGNED